MAATFNVLGVCFLLLLSFVQSRHVQNSFSFIQPLEGSYRGQSVKGLKDLKLYLAKFGYFDYDQVTNKGTTTSYAKDDEFDDLLESAIKKFQQFYGLNVTGGLDSDTVKQMMKPRCGVPDFVNRSHSRYRRGRHHHSTSIRFVGHYQFFPENPRWPSDQTVITYQIRNFAQLNLTPDVNGICARAFKKWSDVLKIFTFQEVPEGPSYLIEVNFHRGEPILASDNGFDGFKGILAHSTSPSGSASFVHFDADEVWGSVPQPTEVDMESVALHEIGHVLGLNHSSVPEAVMFPTIDYGVTKRDLAQDDIDGILDLYN